MTKGEDGYKANISKRHVGQIASRISCLPYGTPQVHTALYHTHTRKKGKKHLLHQMLDIIQHSHVQCGVGVKAKDRLVINFYFTAPYVHDVHRLYLAVSR